MAAKPTECSMCKGHDFWERPSEHGGGWVCARCHPDPRVLVVEWKAKQAAKAAAEIVIYKEGEDGEIIETETPALGQPQQSLF